jgi:hypothetical protein
MAMTFVTPVGQVHVPELVNISISSGKRLSIRPLSDPPMRVKRFSDTGLFAATSMSFIF